MHPRDPRRTPGGSSSGSAAAVAAGMVRFAYGTQTVGSTIRPAAYCGVVGYKPSYGMISRSGMKMGAESLDTVGVIARDVADAALLAAASAMRDDLLEVERAGEAAPRRLPLAQLAPHVAPKASTSFESAVERLAAKGARIVELEMPLDELDAASAIILVYEMARGLAHEVAQSPLEHQPDAPGAPRCRRSHAVRAVCKGDRLCGDLPAGASGTPAATSMPSSPRAPPARRRSVSTAPATPR